MSGSRQSEMVGGGPDYSPGTLPPVAFSVPEKCAGFRLDQALARLLPAHSRNRLQAWIRDGRVRVDGAVCDSPSRRVRGGERIDAAPTAEPAALADRAEAIDLDVVFEDEAVIVVNKPAGLVTHPGSGNWSGTLVNALLHHDARLEAVPRAGIVHRLDKNTSGLLVVARTLASHTALVRQMQRRTVERTYLAVVHGCLARGGTIDAPIGRHPVQRTRMAVVAGGRTARTHYEVVERFAAATRAACRLETGRTHQIRVHFASIGHPLIGDPDYGPRRCAPELDFGRQALHAMRLALDHPVSGARMVWEAPPPEDLRALLEGLRGEGPRER